MDIKVTFYKSQDGDLCKLIDLPYFSIGNEIKRALAAYSKGINITISAGDITSVKSDKKRKYTKFFRLVEGVDDDIIYMLYAVKPRLRNKFIKNIFRKYLADDSFDLYYFGGKKNDMIRKMRERIKVSPPITHIDNDVVDAVEINRHDYQQNRDKGIHPNKDNNSRNNIPDKRGQGETQKARYEDNRNPNRQNRKQSFEKQPKQKNLNDRVSDNVNNTNKNDEFENFFELNTSQAHKPINTNLSSGNGDNK